MAKQKLPKSLTTVTSFTKLIALFLFILLPFIGFYFGIEYQKETAILQPDKVEQLVYRSPDGTISFIFPANWDISFSGKDPQYAAYTEVPEDKKDITLTGPEGSLEFSWTDSYGGACPDGYGQIVLKSETLEMCHISNESGESWNFAKKLYANGLGVGVYAKANQPVQKNRDVILGILSSMKFKPVN